MRGRPTKITDLVLGKLREAFLLGCTDREACIYADICPDTLYEYQKTHADYADQKELYKSYPILLARKSVINAMEKDPYLALKFLERKKKDEFSLRQNIDLTSGNRPIPILGGESVKY